MKTLKFDSEIYWPLAKVLLSNLYTVGFLDKTLRSSDNSKYRLCEGILTRFPFWKDRSDQISPTHTTRFAYIDQDEWKSNNPL